jgi:predicted hydrocarbon binding protein
VSIDLAGAGMVGLTRDTLATLHARLFADPSGTAAAYLQEAGYAGGPALHQAFVGWCASQGLNVPEEMGGPEFGQRSAEFFSKIGWGSLTSGMLHDSVMTLDSEDWAEANPASGMQYPGCYLSAGLLADFFGRIANAQLAVMEVECRSMGHARCRFIVGSAETIQHVYDGLMQGVHYDAALAAMA